MIRLMVPSVEEDDVRAVAGILRSGWLVEGARVKAFEGRLAFCPGGQHGPVEDTSHAYQSYVVLLPREVASRRAEVTAPLREKGIEAAAGTYPRATAQP